MKVEDVRARVAKIVASKGDYDIAHGMEDDLFLDVLKAIAAGAKEPKALAAEAIKSADIDFPRETY